MIKPTTYPGCHISTETKSFMVRLYLAQKEEGECRKTFLQNKIEDTGYHISPRSLDCCIANVKSTGTALSLTKKTGADSILDDDEKAIAAGWIFEQNELNNIVSLKAYREFVEHSFEVRISTSTCSRYLKETGLSSKRERIHSQSYKNELSEPKHMF